MCIWSLAARKVGALETKFVVPGGSDIEHLKIKHYRQVSLAREPEQHKSPPPSGLF
jgi:hypothetical protein